MELSHAGIGTQANPRLPGKPEPLPGVGCSDFVSSSGHSVTPANLAGTNLTGTGEGKQQNRQKSSAH